MFYILCENNTHDEVQKMINTNWTHKVVTTREPFAILKNVAKEIPQAKTTTLYTEEGIEVTKFKGIQSEAIKNEVLYIPSKNYSLIQHEDVINTTIDTLTELGIGGKGWIEYDEIGRKMSTYLLFNDKFIQDDAEGIQLGIKLTNSIDGSSGIQICSFAERLVCSNGMTMKEVTTIEKKGHVYLKQPQQTISEMLRNVINQDQKIQQIVETALTESIAWETMQTLLYKMMNERYLTTKHLEPILEKVGISIVKIQDKKTKKKSVQFIREKSYTGKKWDLYNAFTWYMSHTCKLSYNISNWMQTLSEEVLLAPTQE